MHVNSFTSWLNEPLIFYLRSIIINVVPTLFQTRNINQAACDLAKGVAQEGGAYVAGCICQTAVLYSQGAGKDVVMKKFRNEIEIFIQNNVDILIAEVSVS